jgi:hypothetical protein
MKNQFPQRDLPQFETTQQATPSRHQTLLWQSAALALLAAAYIDQTNLGYKTYFELSNRKLEFAILYGTATVKILRFSRKSLGLLQYLHDYLIAFFNILAVTFFWYGFVASLFDHLGLPP